MKKVFLILLTAVAFSCGDGNRNTSEYGTDNESGGDNTELAEPSDTTSVESDTTSTGDMDRRQDDGDMDRGEAGTEKRDSL